MSPAIRQNTSYRFGVAARHPRFKGAFKKLGVTRMTTSEVKKFEKQRNNLLKGEGADESIYNFRVGNKSIAMIFVNTNLAAAAGAIVAMFTSWIKFGKPEIGISLNGVLAGLVAITAGCANVMPGSAVIIGAVAGLLVVLSVVFFDRIRVDDPVGAISVHGINGAWGTLAAGLFNMGGTSFFPSSAYSCWVSWRVSPGPSPWHLACLS